MPDLPYELPRNCNFSEVTNGSNQEFSCSPKLADPFFSDFDGMLINAPNEIVWKKNINTEETIVGPWGQTSGPYRLMLAGLLNAPYKTLELKGETSQHVVVVAVNQKTAQAYIGKMPRPEFSLGLSSSKPFPLKARARSEDELNALISNHFNFDLVHDLGLPISDATYHIYATLGEYTSNVLTIKTNVEK